MKLPRWGWCMCLGPSPGQASQPGGARDMLAHPVKPPELMRCHRPGDPRQVSGRPLLPMVPQPLPWPLVQLPRSIRGGNQPAGLASTGFPHVQRALDPSPRMPRTARLCWTWSSPAIEVQWMILCDGFHSSND